MSSIRSILSLSLLMPMLFPCILASVPIPRVEDNEDFDAFQKLLDQVDPPALHEALHNLSPKKFKHGAFPEDSTAVKVIHKEEPSLATSIINMAQRQEAEVVELVRRQAGGNNNATTPTNTPPAPGPQSTTRVTPVPPISEGSTLSPGGPTTASTANPTNSASPDTLTTSAPPSTASNAASITTSATSDASVITSGSATTASITDSSNPSPSLTTGQIITTTNGVGLTIISTVGGGATTISNGASVTSSRARVAGGQTSVLVQTSQLPNGSKSVITAVTVVGGSTQPIDTPTGTAGVANTGTSAAPGLQTGEAVMTRAWGKEMVLVVGGAVAFAGMM